MDVQDVQRRKLTINHKLKKELKTFSSFFVPYYYNDNIFLQRIKKKSHMTCELLSCYGGGRGIRTPATLSRPVGFQDRSLQPDLGIPPYQQYRLYRNIIILSIIYLNFFIFLNLNNLDDLLSHDSDGNVVHMLL